MHFYNRGVPIKTYPYIVNETLMIEVRFSYAKEFEADYNFILDAFIHDLEEIKIKDIIGVPIEEVKEIKKFFVMSLEGGLILLELSFINEINDYRLTLIKNIIKTRYAHEINLTGWMAEDCHKKVLNKDYRNIIVKFDNPHKDNVAIIFQPSFLTVHEFNKTRIINEKKYLEANGGKKKKETLNLDCELSDEEYIYILTNDYMSCIKIGKAKDVDERIRQLSSATGVPAPFKLAYKCRFRNAYKVERHIHKYFYNLGYKLPNREFVDVDVNEAIEFVKSINEEEI